MASIGTTSKLSEGFGGIDASAAPIPGDLASLLPVRKTPWLISQALFERMQKQAVDATKSFKACPVERSDQEYNLVLRYFSYSKPPGLSIKKIHCIHNPLQTQGFEAALQTMEKGAVKFPGAWKDEEPKPERANTIKRWEALVEQFSPISLSTSQREDILTAAKILPLWHGTPHIESVCSSGFTFFGKHHLVDSSAKLAKAGPSASTDIGFFGSGIYFTNSAHYASMYHSGNLLFSWVSMRTPYPVVSDVPIPKKGRDMLTLEGQGAYQNYNAHYIPVTSADPKDPNCMIYHPCYKTERPAWDEVVIFQSFQALPRFWLELGVDFPASPATSPTTVNDLQNKIFELLEKDSVKQDVAVFNLLSEKIEVLIGLDPDSPLSSQEQEFNRWILQLLDPSTGKLRSFVKLKLAQSKSSASSGKLEEKKSPLSASLSASLLSSLPPVDENERNALHKAAEEGKIDLIRSLLTTHKYLLESKDAEGNTPLFLAAFYRHPEACAILLKAGANPAASNKYGLNGLHNAAGGGDTDVTRLILEADKKLLESKDLEENVPLLTAAYYGNIEVYAFLLKAGANPNTTNKHGENALHNATETGRINIVQMILETHKYLLESKDASGNTALLLAAYRGHTELCTFLLKAGANADSTDSNGQNVLHSAADEGKIGVIQLLLEHYKYLLEAKDEAGCTPLLLASDAGHAEACALLIEAGANPAVTGGKFGRNAMHSAAAEGRTDVVQLLLDTHKDLLESKNGKGNTPLLLAANFGHVETCVLLLKAGANPNATGLYGQNALHKSASTGMIDVVQLLLNTNKQLLETEDEDGNTPLILAGDFNFTEICVLLLKAGANPNATNHDGLNVLYMAVSEKNSELMQLLLKTNKQLLELQNSDGFTPLLLTAFHGNAEACALLLEAGANPRATLKNGKTALDLATEAGHESVIKLLPSDREELATVDANGRNALHLSAIAGEVDSLRSFLDKHKSLIDAKDTNSDAPLLLAAFYGHAQVCATLLTNGANPNISNREGQNPIHCAVKQGKISVVRVLLMYCKDLLDSLDAAGNTPLLLAAELGDVQLCELLLNAGANPHVLNKPGNRAIHNAANTGKVDVVKFLLAARKDILETKDANGYTPLLSSAYFGQAEVCTILLKAGANLKTTLENGKTVFEIAKEAGHESVVKLLSTYFTSPLTKEEEKEILLPVSAIPTASALSWDITPSASASSAVAIPSMACGAHLWTSHLGKVDEAPFPAELHEILKSPCPFWPGKRVKETHMLVLIPKTITATVKRFLGTAVVSMPHTLNNLDKLLTAPFLPMMYMKVGYYRHYKPVQKQYGDQPNERVHWLLMTNDVIPDSRGKSYAVQKEMVEKAGYEVPHALDATSAIFLNYIRSGKRFFKDNPYTYTHCQEKCGNQQLVVGAFLAFGLNIGADAGDLGDFVGIAGARSFFV